jgi:hypothetical protein
MVCEGIDRYADPPSHPHTRLRLHMHRKAADESTHAHLPADCEEVHKVVKRPRVALLAIVVDAALTLKGLDELITCIWQWQSVTPPTRMLHTCISKPGLANECPPARIYHLLAPRRRGDAEGLHPFAHHGGELVDGILVPLSWSRPKTQAQFPTTHSKELWFQNALRTASSPSLEIVTVAKLLPP